MSIELFALHLDLSQELTFAADALGLIWRLHDSEAVLVVALDGSHVHNQRFQGQVQKHVAHVLDRHCLPVRQIKEVKDNIIEALLVALGNIVYTGKKALLASSNGWRLHVCTMNFSKVMYEIFSSCLALLAACPANLWNKRKAHSPYTQNHTSYQTIHSNMKEEMKSTYGHINELKKYVFVQAVLIARSTLQRVEQIEDRGQLVIGN